MNDYDTRQQAFPVEKRNKGLPDNKPWLNVLLFVLTFLSTWLTQGVSYAVAIMTILLAHEMGHYIQARRYNVSATLPYFIPFPLLNPFGTLGAVIQMRGTIPNRRALFDIGATGPLSGFVFTVPITILGIYLSEIIAVKQVSEYAMTLGDSLLFKGLVYWIKGPLPEGHDLFLHPVAYAGWAGFFVTALNLLPVGQLDGGHVIYSVLGKKAKYAYYVFLVALGLLTLFYPLWTLLFILLLFFGRRHPPPQNDEIRLDTKRKVLVILVWLIFITSFIPFPFKL
jgi:membrane-associated protease RseP (regulator of RpoE activity)